MEISLPTAMKLQYYHRSKHSNFTSTFQEDKYHRKFMKWIFVLTSRTTNYYEFLHKQLWHLVSLTNLVQRECILHQTILHFHWKVQKHSGVTWNFCNLKNPYKWIVWVLEVCKILQLKSTYFFLISTWYPNLENTPK